MTKFFIVAGLLVVTSYVLRLSTAYGFHGMTWEHSLQEAKQAAIGCAIVMALMLGIIVMSAGSGGH